MANLEQNKEVVRRFNLSVIQRGDAEVAKTIFAADFVNHSAPPGMPTGPEGMLNTFNHILRPALKDMRVEIQDQVAEGELVTTRKTISGQHTGVLMGIPATGKSVTIQVIDIVRVRDGQYLEHWGVNNLPSVLAQLQTK